MKFWNSPDFKALRDEWYLRLQAEGFEDAEEVIKGKSVLKKRASGVYRGTHVTAREAKEMYFAMLSQCVYTHWFDDDIERKILSWYAQGWRIREICEDLERQGEPRARNTVRFIIRRYEVLWGLKTYSREEMNLYPRKPIP